MKGDFTRVTFDPHKHYSRVLMQQGRVQLDADWNEMVETQLHFLRTLAADLIGPHGGPGESFKINDKDAANKSFAGTFEITRGHYYVDGILCVNSSPLLYDGQVSFTRQSFGDLSGNEAKSYVVYLDVWERHVTYVEDANEDSIGIREMALRRPDTTTRTQIVWQVKCIPITIVPPPNFKDDYEGFTNWLATNHVKELSSGTLRARAIKPSSGDPEPCLTSPEARYRGAENQLYRVEIHQSGPAWDGDKGTKGKAATFKWSRENGAVIFSLEEPGGSIVTLAHLGHDDRFGLRPDDWVEIVDDDYVLQNRAEPLLQIKDIDPDTLQVTLKQSPSPTVGKKLAKHPLLRRWDSSNVSMVEVPTSNNGWITLEDGVEIKFDVGVDKKSFFRTGDYWLIPARVTTGDVEWPGPPGDPQPLPPHGVVHHYAPLALISLDTSGTVQLVPPEYRRTLTKSWS